MSPENGGQAETEQVEAPFRPPEPNFSVISVQAVKRSATPMMLFHLHVTESEGREVYAIPLTVQINIDPAQRSYEDVEKERLFEVFGSPERWSNTTHSFLWTQQTAMVPTFTGATTFELAVPCTYDLEVVSAKYFHSLEDGTVPLTFHFSGTVFYRGPSDQLQVILVPWSCQARFRLPVVEWKAMMESHYPAGTWVAVQSNTMDALARFKAQTGSPTFDKCILDLVTEASKRAGATASEE